MPILGLLVLGVTFFVAILAAVFLNVLFSSSETKQEPVHDPNAPPGPFKSTVLAISESLRKTDNPTYCQRCNIHMNRLYVNNNPPYTGTATNKYKCPRCERTITLTVS